MKLSTGKLRGLQQLASPKGLLTMCANDHRGALKRALNPEDPGSVSYQEMVDFKLDLCQALAPSSSAMLLDPLYGAAQAIASGIMPGNVGLLVSLEKTGYTSEGTARLTEIQPNWGVEKVKKLGASAAKLLVYFRPDLENIASRQLDLVAKMANRCTEEDIPFLVEPVSYPVEQASPSAKSFAEMKPELVIETARQMTTLPIDILKAEFPADMAFEQDEGKLLSLCQELNEASKLPWVILSAGVDYKTFKKQVELACKAGASGFLAGRALWQEGARIKSRQERMDFFKTTAAPRLEELSGLASSLGKPWYSKLGIANGEFDALPDGWYQSY